MYTCTCTKMILIFIIPDCLQYLQYITHSGILISYTKCRLFFEHNF